MSQFNSADETSKMPKILCGGLFIAVLATLVYWPSLKGTFIVDDDQYVTNNPNIYLTSGLARLWSTKALAQVEEFYYPVSYSSFWLEWRLWGKWPTGFRITNLTLHIVTAWLLWAILRKLLIPGAFLGALLFTVHPLNVECVAWIFQRRDLLAMAFCLSSIACYLQADPRFLAGSDELDPGQGRGRRCLPLRKWGWYALSLAAYTLAMLSKLSAAPLPVILLLMIWWKDRIRFWDIARIGPFFLVGGALTGLNLWLRLPPTRSPSLAERLDRAGAVVWFYLSKALVPIKLSFTYPLWQINTSALLWWLPLLAAASVTAVLFWRRQGAWGRALIFAWLFFCVAIAPVSGIDDVGGFGHSIVWDHYEHLALIGAIVLVAAGWGYWRQRTRMRRGSGALAVVLVCILSVLTFQRSSLFGSPINFYQDALLKNPDSWLLNVNYGSALAKNGQTEEAVERLQHLVQIWPDYPEGHRRLGTVLLQAGQPRQAAEYFQQALRIDPSYPPAHNLLGLAYQLTDRLPEAIKEFEFAILINPEYGLAHFNLGNALSIVGRTSDAIGHIREALRLKPEWPEAETALALALAHQGQLPEAIEHYQRALRLESNNPEILNNLGAALSKAGRPQEAIVQLQKALQFKPEFPEAHHNLGIAFSRADRTPEGIEQFQEALRLKPDFADAHLNLGVALCKGGQLQDGLMQLKEALRLNPDSIDAYTNMTQAYVLLNLPAEAIASAEKALELARAQGKAAETGELTEWLASYRSQHNDSSSVAPQSIAEPPANRP